MVSNIPESISKLFDGDEVVSMVVEPTSLKPKIVLFKGKIYS